MFGSFGCVQDGVETI